MFFFFPPKRQNKSGLKADASFTQKSKSIFTLIKTDCLHAGLKELDGVIHHRRASGVLRPSPCWSGGSSHTPRKDTAVSLSSISSAAVASSLDRENSLIVRPSTIFQVLFCGTRNSFSILYRTH